MPTSRLNFKRNLYIYNVCVYTNLSNELLLRNTLILKEEETWGGLEKTLKERRTMEATYEYGEPVTFKPLRRVFYGDVLPFRPKEDETKLYRERDRTPFTFFDRVKRVTGGCFVEILSLETRKNGEKEAVKGGIFNIMLSHRFCTMTTAPPILMFRLERLRYTEEREYPLGQRSDKSEDREEERRREKHFQRI